MSTLGESEPSTPRSQPLAAGDRVGEFTVLSELGLGAMGSVYRARDSLGRELALKVLTGKIEPRRVERFAREGRVTARLSHPGIVRVHGAGVSQGGSPYLAYELVVGEDLEKAWRRLSMEQLLGVIQEVAQALGHAHSLGVLHRDLKPANVLLDSEGKPRVADFGLAHVMGLERLTLSGAVVGTPSYMAPEQVGGDRSRYGPHTDVWALGVFLYRALTGRLPFVGASLVELMAKIATAHPTPPRSLNPSVCPHLQAVCLRALASAPQARFANASEFSAALKEARAGTRSPASSSTRLALSAAVVLLSLVAGVGAVTTAYRSEAAGGLEEPAPQEPEPGAALEARWRPVIALAEAGSWREARRTLRELVETAPLDAFTGFREEVVAQGISGSELEARESVGLLAIAAAVAKPNRNDPRELRLADRVLVIGLAALEAVSSEDLEGLADPLARSVEFMDRMGEASLRPSITPQLTALLERASMAQHFGALKSSAFLSLVRALSRMDVPLAPNVFRVVGLSPSSSERPWQEPWGVWERYVELRIALVMQPRGRAQASLVALLGDAEDSDPDHSGAGLGPNHWFQTAALVVEHANAAERHAFFERSAHSAPLLPEVHRRLAASFVARGELGHALEAIEVANRLFHQHGYVGQSHMLESRIELDEIRVRVFARLDRRSEATEIYLGLVTRAPRTAAGLQARFPWLAH